MSAFAIVGLLSPTLINRQPEVLWKSITTSLPSEVSKTWKYSYILLPPCVGTSILPIINSSIDAVITGISL